MIRVFLDASVLFSAAYSKTGASREIIRLTIREKIHVVASELVFEEARRNLTAKAPEVVNALEDFRTAAEFEIVRPTKSQIREAMEYVAAKDAPIVAAAKRANVDFLVSLDQTHLVGVPVVTSQSGMAIVLPGQLLEEIRPQLAND